MLVIIYYHMQKQGKKLNFLGMEIEFLGKGKFGLGNVQCSKNSIEKLEEFLKPFGEYLNNIYAHSATKNLNVVRPNCEAVCPGKTDIYCSYMAMFIWFMKRGRLDIKPTMSFLCTPVKGPTKDNWHKFKRLACFLKRTVNDVQTIGADDLLNMIVMIDSSHAVHGDMRGHTGGVTIFGTGVID